MKSNLTENQVNLIINSFHFFLKEPFPYNTAPEKIYNGNFVLLSHNSEKDPIFNYANLKAQELFEMDWEAITNMPSRFSAEPMEQSERNLFLEKTIKNGYVENYNGIRISRTGKRFWIKDAIIWNLVDEHQIYKGQAALFSKWEFIP
jgi:hypothetical protein